MFLAYLKDFATKSVDPETPQIHETLVLRRPLSAFSGALKTAFGHGSND